MRRAGRGPRSGISFLTWWLVAAVLVSCHGDSDALVPHLPLLILSPVCLPVCLSVCLSACLFVCLCPSVSPLFSQSPPKRYWFMLGNFGFFSTASLAAAPHVVVSGERERGGPSRLDLGWRTAHAERRTGKSARDTGPQEWVRCAPPSTPYPIPKQTLLHTGPCLMLALSVFAQRGAGCQQVLVFDVTLRSFQQMLRERAANELCLCYRKIVRRAAKQGAVGLCPLCFQLRNM